MPTEDSQPNESRILPKGAGVPAIRSTQPRRPFGRFRGSSRGTGPRPNPPRFQSGHSRIANADLPSDLSHVTHSSSHIVSYNVHPSSSGSNSYPLFQPPKPAIGPPVPFPDTSIPGPSHQADHLPDSHLNENLDPISNVRIGHLISSSNPGGTPNENKRRVANEQELRRPRKRANKSSEKLEEQVFDVPENCRKGVIDSRMARIQFDRCIVDGLKEHTGAKIHSKRFEGDRFIVIYTAPPIPAVIVSQPTSDVSMPSGSDTKLEDLILLSESRPPSRSPPTGSTLPSQIPSATIDENNSRSFVIKDEETVMRLPNRPIRSGVLSLSYGPQRESVRTPLPSVEAKPRSPEVIEIEDSPPPSPLIKKEKEVATYDIVAAIRERAKVAASLCLKKETADAVRLPKDISDKPRRILISHSLNMSFVVSVHGVVHEITRALPRRQRELCSFKSASKETIDDTCLLAPPYDGIAVIGQADEKNALSLLHLTDEVKQCRVPVERESSNRDRALRGVSAVTALSTSTAPLAFISAGYDHVLHIWTLDPSFSLPPKPHALDVRHTSLVQSLLVIPDTVPKLLSAGADCCVNVWDLSAERKLGSTKTSNSVYQLHRTERPECVLLEVAHRDSQFELHDYRAFIGKPAQRFGFTSTQVQGRFHRGDVNSLSGVSTFVSGGRDGRVRLWDLRNTGRCKQEIECFPGQRIVHATFDGDNVVVVSDDNRLMFFNTTFG